MDHTEHVLLVGAGAQAFADEMGHPRMLPRDLVTAEARAEYERFKNGTYAKPVGELFNK